MINDFGLTCGIGVGNIGRILLLLAYFDFIKFRKNGVGVPFSLVPTRFRWC